MNRQNIQREIVLKCLLERDEADSWFAICLDLNVYARASSCGEARARLKEEIQHYISEAYTKDRDHFADLVWRRAPVRFWISYYVAGIKEKFFGPKAPPRSGIAGYHATVPLAPVHG
jgi:predicted RNase H-like HicB family nuclease